MTIGRHRAKSKEADVSVTPDHTDPPTARRMRRPRQLPHPAARRDRRRWPHITRRAVEASVAAFMLLVVGSIGSALTAPGTDSVAARLAEWARGHGLSGLVTWAENQQYQHHK